jgi:hypothetical protein
VLRALRVLKALSAKKASKAKAVIPEKRARKAL